MEGLQHCLEFRGEARAGNIKVRGTNHMHELRSGGELRRTALSGGHDDKDSNK